MVDAGFELLATSKITKSSERESEGKASQIWANDGVGAAGRT